MINGGGWEVGEIALRRARMTAVGQLEIFPALPRMSARFHDLPLAARRHAVGPKSMSLSSERSVPVRLPASILLSPNVDEINRLLRKR